MTEGNTVFPWTFDATFDPNPNWLLDGEPIPRATDETATQEGVSLTFRVTTSVLENRLRPLKADEGKVAVLPTDDGGFVSVDRANGDNSFQFRPPTTREPLRERGTYHVDRYEESLVSQDVGEWTVELELSKADNRTDSPSLSQSPAADEWGFTTRFGTIATGRVDAELVGTGEGGVERYELITRLTFEQAHVFEAALSLLNGTRIRERPDTTNVVEDATSGDANTLTVDAPDGQSTVADGDYVVTEWTSERLNDAYQSLEWVMIEV